MEEVPELLYYTNSLAISQLGHSVDMLLLSRDCRRSKEPGCSWILESK
jgi:hypothetical protein